MANMKYLLNCISFISLMVLFSFFDNFGMDLEEEKATLFKVIFVGDAGVGKTQIIKNFLGEKFSDVYELTSGVEDISKDITIQGTKRRLQMFDCPGQEKYKGIISSYVKGSSIVFLIYDVTSKSSFDNIQTWIDFIKDKEKNTTLVLCGNKIDLENREVTTEEGEALAQKEKIAFFEVSAKTGEKIKNMFYTVVDLSILNGCKLTKENLVKELLQENKNGNEAGSKNIERSFLCSMCIDCFENCFKK